MRRVANIFRVLFQKNKLDEDLDAELQFYYAMLVDRYVGAGMEREQARRAARLEMGRIETIKENTREIRTGAGLETVMQDFRYAVRTLRKYPAFSAIAILTLALGLGVNTAIFSIVDAVLLKPLPYERPERLALVWSDFEKTAAYRAPTSATILSEIKHRSSLLEDVAAIWPTVGTFIGEEDAEQIRVGQVTTNFFTTLGARPLLGRGFVAEEEHGGRAAMILTDRLWRRRFGGDPNILGKKVPFQGADYTVVGVLAPHFRLVLPASIASDVEAFTPFPNDIYKGPRTLYFLRLVARMKPGVRAEQAQREMTEIARQIRETYSEYHAENLKLSIVSMHRDAVRDIRPALIALFAGAGFVMLICCVNVANLLLARASERRKEVALRSAIGASRTRILRQLLTEGAMICAIAGTIGLTIGWGALRGLPRLQPEALARGGEIGLNWTVLVFVAAVSIGSVLLFGLVPSIESAKWDLIATLREAGKTSRTPVRRGVRAALIVAEVTFGFILVVGAGLMMRTLEKIEQVRPGFESDRVLTFSMNIPFGRFKSDEAIYSFVREWDSAIAALPGVAAVGAASHLPLDNYPNWYSPFRPEGVSETQGAALLADYRSVTPGFFQAMGTRLIEGRFFDETDRAGARQVVIVDDLLASTIADSRSAIGKRIESEHITDRGFTPVWSEVVGVVEHVRVHSLSKKIRPEIYIPFEQSPRSPLSYAVYARVDPLTLAGPIRDLLRQRNRSVAISKVRPMEEYVEQAEAPASFTALMAGIFGGLALLLAAIGIYGVTYCTVSRRMPEMGIRMALGASAGDVKRMVLKEGLTLTALGLIFGIGGALAISRQLQDLIYGISTVDPVTYIAAILVIPAAALIGCWKPASKAAGANPVDVIRIE